MSAERALLRRVKVLLECSNMEPLQRQTDLIVGEIKDLLAQPKQEPFKPDWVNYRQGVEDAKREPLSEEAVGELLMGGFSTHLIDLVRMIEKAHGIGEQK
jgi:hypothetical protein